MKLQGKYDYFLIGRSSSSFTENKNFKALIVSRIVYYSIIILTIFVWLQHHFTNEEMFKCRAISENGSGCNAALFNAYQRKERNAIK